jgi:hypothetical protein
MTDTPGHGETASLRPSIPESRQLPKLEIR